MLVFLGPSVATFFDDVCVINCTPPLIPDSGLNSRVKHDNSVTTLRLTCFDD